MDTTISIILYLIGLGFLVSLSAFFSGSETALFSLSKTQVERLRQGTGKSGAIVARLLDAPRRLLITILVGNMFVNVAFASVVASLVTAIFGNKGAGLAVGATTVLLLVFGEITPKTVAVHNAEPISKLAAYPIHLFSKLIFPLRIVLRTVTNWILDAGYWMLDIGKRRANRGSRIEDRGSRRNNIPIEDRLTTEEFKAMVEIAEEEGSIKEREKEMINTIFDLRSITAAEIMVPRTEMVCISEDSTLQQVFDLARTVGRSRIPVYRNDIDHIYGIAYVRDFPIWRHVGDQGSKSGEPKVEGIGQRAKGKERGAESEEQEEEASHNPYVLNSILMKMTVEQFLRRRQKLWSRGRDTLIRPPFFVPETRTAMGLFQDFRDRGVQMAILLDEYGGTAGLVTMEDLVEELVGEITDEYDAVSEDFRPLDDFTTVVSGGASIRNVNKRLGLNLSAEEDIDTIGGYVVHLFGRIPERGEVLPTHGLEFEVAEVDRQRVARVVIRKVDAGY
jgi:putative hemolysin